MESDSPSSASFDRATSVLIAALGGEGGGVLANWIFDAAVREGYPAQATSIPGLAQRTGATTYYLEIFPGKREALEGRDPVLSLTPSPGDIDVVVASELLEAGRAMQHGYVSPQRTTLIASTHRVYVSSELMHGGDGRYDSVRILVAARQLARHAVLFDMRAIARAESAALNAVLFGAIAAIGTLPLSRASCEESIRRSERDIEANLRGFEAGYRHAYLPSQEKQARALQSKSLLGARIGTEFPPDTHEVLTRAVARLIDYQDEDYAEVYLDRMAKVLAADASASHSVTNKSGRYLALWMSYEDVIRVADLKTRVQRFRRLRKEIGPNSRDAVVVVDDYLKPGIEEFASLLSPALGSWILSRTMYGIHSDLLSFGLRIRTSSVHGYVLMRALAKLKFWRPRTHRYSIEQKLIECWLAALIRAAMRDTRLALEVSECARLVKGYGATRRRGVANIRAMLHLLEGSAAADGADAQARAISRAREAALSDPDGNSFPGNPDWPASAAKPTSWSSQST